LTKKGDDVSVARTRSSKPDRGPLCSTRERSVVKVTSQLNCRKTGGTGPRGNLHRGEGRIIKPVSVKKRNGGTNNVEKERHKLQLRKRRAVYAKEREKKDEAGSKRQEIRLASGIMDG